MTRVLSWLKPLPVLELAHIDMTERGIDLLYSFSLSLGQTRPLSFVIAIRRFCPPAPVLQPLHPMVMAAP